MFKRLLLLCLVAGAGSCALAQERQTENVIIITLDGFRWQELFAGADSSLIYEKDYVHDKSVLEKFWDSSPVARRQKLMPFFWNVIGAEGQLYGNRELGNRVNCANPYWFSYPGYSEMMTGFVDNGIRSNDKKENPNATVLEYIHKQKEYTGKVAVFSTWNVIPYIVRAQAHGIPANAGEEHAIGDTLSDCEMLLNALQPILKNGHGERYDAFTFFYAFEYLKRERPRVMFISFDETDEHGHGGRYDEYLKSAHHTDRMISQLWQWLQSQEDYKNKTTLLITTDHGRGHISRKAWKNHGRLIPGSSQMWFAVIGPDTPVLGEMKNEAQYFQKQVAKTAAAFLGIHYENTEPVGEVIESMFIPELLSDSRIMDLHR
ncbi:MAG TPA: alkaline phosphatase family protein [Ohtaekwangia sp.]|uniref:alkaline phosphatase family protein n=1 Tax=Ohtaekwangia sp. TaxID=2066019 RepID=UPI002F93DE50